MRSSSPGLSVLPNPPRAAAALAMALLVLLGASGAGGLRGSGSPAASASRLAVAVDEAVDRALQTGQAARVVVQAQQGHEADAARAVTDAGGEVVLPLPIVDGFAARLTTEGLARLRALGGDVVRAVTFDGAVHLHHTPAPGQTFNDSFFPDTIKASQLRRAGIDGGGVGIAVMDTGVSPVGDLSGRVVGGIDLSGEGDGTDRFGHGTFIAGIAAGNGAASGGAHAGVAPGANIVPVKIAGANGASDVSHVLAGLQWVVSYKNTYRIGVLNLSFGTDSIQTQLLDPLNYAVERAWDAGIVVVVSAGNAGPGPSTMLKPADDPLVITVGATDSNGTVDRDDDIVPAFSSRGPTRADGYAKPDIVAPGAHLIGLRSPGSTIDTDHPEARVEDSYFRGSGTSFSTAVVSGAVALLRQAHPLWTPDQIKGALLSTAARGPVGDPNVDGRGAIDVAKANGLLTPPSANQGVVRSSGLGTLAASRGSLDVSIVTDPVLGATQILSGETTAQNQLFDPLRYTLDPWTADSWTGNQWYGNQWYGNQWYGNQWYSTAWNGNQWYGNQWYGNQWYGNQWF